MTVCYQPLGAVEIRSATTLADLHVIAGLARFIWRRCYPVIISEAQIEYMLGLRYGEEPLAEAARTGSPAYLLLTVDGEPLAFAAHRDTEIQGELQLQQLYVHPDWQRQGLGKRLLDHVEHIARAQGRNALVLTVNRRNEPARQAYLKSGFTVREQVVVDIGNGFVMDDEIMVKRLA